MLRSIIALIGGFALMAFSLAAATVCAALAMGVTATTIPNGYFQVLLACAILAAAFGGYSTAALAPDRHFGHSIVLATIVLIVQVSTVLTPPPNQPYWYLLTLVVAAPLAALAGGRIRVLQRLRRAASAPTT